MERFVVVTTCADQRSANAACVAIEGNAIPVMIEHIHVKEKDLHGVAFRVLVPMQFSQKALGILSGLDSTYIAGATESTAALRKGPRSPLEKAA